LVNDIDVILNLHKKPDTAFKLQSTENWFFNPEHSNLNHFRFGQRLKCNSQSPQKTWYRVQVTIYRKLDLQSWTFKFELLWTL